MKAARWLDPGARDRVARAIGRIETRTSAELVVAVCFASESYRDVGQRLGALAALALLIAYVYAPFPFYDDLLLVEVVAVFAGVGLLAPRIAWLVRVATTRKRRRAAVEARAKLGFVDQRIADTRHRTGILIQISVLERELVAIPDVGIATADVPEWSATIAALEQALAAPAPIDRVLDLLEVLGGALATVHPSVPDDVNELPDGLVSP
jgi:putative membrane protein